MKRTGTLLLALFLGVVFASHCEATVYYSDGSETSVQYLHDNLAQDGDEVALPNGTFTWTSGVMITKGITLRGETTTDSVRGTSGDQTIIVDNVVRQSGGAPIIRINSVLGKSYRVSGLTFRGGSTQQNNNGAIVLGGNSHSVRLDHCHFDSSLSAPDQALYVGITGAIYGVADHNVMEFTGSQSITFHMDNWPNPDGSPGVNGDGSWATPTNFGSEAFFFVEDNYMVNQSNFNELAGNTDDTRGGRWVFRYNHCYDIEMQSHGTEVGRYRGGRAREIYNNDFHNAHAHAMGGVRSGVTISHDNTFDGVQPTRGMVLEAYRAFNRYLSPWGGGSGDNPWDVNDTRNGPFTENGFIYNPVNGLYESGTASSGSTTTLVDTAKNWQPNMWINFVAKRVSDGAISLILSNTSNTLTVYYFTGTSPTWQFGDEYRIHRSNTLLDQPGRGQGDLVVGSSPIPAWPNQQLEPSYCWNDRYTPTNASVGFQAGIGNGVLQQAERDYFNDTPIPGYTPYIYPHPLVSGDPPPLTVTPTPTPTSTPAPSPTPTATPTSTPAPSPTPTPTATPCPTATPTPCVATVPNFVGAKILYAQTIWQSAGFTTKVTTNGPPGHRISSQNLPPSYQGDCSTTTIFVSD